MYRERQFLKLCAHIQIMGKQRQQKGEVGENQGIDKER
jgi:hypothetical protein